VTGVDVLVDVAVVVDALDELADKALVPLVTRADEEVGAGIEPFRQLFPGDCDLVDVLVRVGSLLLCDPVDPRRVLVDSGQEERLGTALPVMPRQDVRRNRRVRVPDVRGRVHVVDRGRHVEAHRRQ